MNESLEAAPGLARKAEHDWKNASASLEHDVPLDTVCFHIQQAAEKLLKALMVTEGIAVKRLRAVVFDLLPPAARP